LAKKDDVIKMDCEVLDVLPNTLFRVKNPDNGHELIAYLGGKMRKRRIRITLGDTVEVEMSPYDLNKGRITYRR
tara:strand:+ start:78 stop:299 length:222 start_codon:yes stop_codon:yes gene_type:complete